VGLLARPARNRRDVGTERLAATETAQAIERAARIVTASSTLQVREREIMAGYTRALAALTREETDTPSDDAKPLVVAQALMGTHRRSSTVSGSSARRSVGAKPRRRYQSARSSGSIGGLGDYAVKP